jgi:tetratricopeptide (TPR) repeat protein
MAKVHAAGSKPIQRERRGAARPPAKEAEKTPQEAAPAPDERAASKADTLSLPTWAGIALLTLAPLAIFFRVLSFPFLTWDDTFLITKNPWMHPVTWASFVHSWHYPLLNLYAPLTHNLYETLVLVSHALHPSQGSGLSPSVFHAASILLHIGSVWTVFALLRRLRFPNYAAFLGAFLFAVHPLVVEGVCWIGGMDTLLSTFLCLLALHQYTIYAQSGANPAKRGMHFGAASILYLLALCAKPGAVSLPIMALVLELFVFRRPIRAFAAPILAWTLVAIAWVHVTQTTQHVPASYTVPVWQRPFVAGDAIAFYLVKLFWPFPMVMDYGRAPGLLVGYTWGYFTWLLPAAVALLAWKLYRAFPPLAAGYGLMVAGTLPTSGLVPFAFQHSSTVADHYTYLALAGPALVLAGLAQRLRPRALYALFGLLLVAGAASFVQTGFWRNSETLYLRDLAVNPHSSYVHDLLADLYMARNEPAKAANQYRIATQIEPTQAAYFYNLAIASAELGNTQEAIDSYQRAIAIDPDSAKARFGLGLVYAETGQTLLAVQQWQIAAQLSPNNPDYHYNLGLALLRLGLYEQSVQQFNIVLVLQPGSPTAQYWLNQALARERAGPKDR